VVAAVALVTLVVRELRVAEPVVDLRVLRHPTFAVATAAMFVISIAFYGIMVLSPLFTQILMGYTAMLAGLVLAPGGLSTLVTMPIAAALLNRRSEEHTSELQSRSDLVCRLLLEKKKYTKQLA